MKEQLLKIGLGLQEKADRYNRRLLIGQGLIVSYAFYKLGSLLALSHGGLTNTSAMAFLVVLGLIFTFLFRPFRRVVYLDDILQAYRVELCDAHEADTFGLVSRAGDLECSLIEAEDALDTAEQDLDDASATDMPFAQTRLAAAQLRLEQATLELHRADEDLTRAQQTFQNELAIKLSNARAALASFS